MIVACFNHSMAEREIPHPEVRLLGDWLARWRCAVGVSQRILADRAGLSQSGLSRLERGLQLVGARRLARLIFTLDDLGRHGAFGPIAPPPLRRPAPGVWGRQSDGWDELAGDRAPTDGWP